MTTGKTIALTTRIFVDKVMFLLFNMLSMLVITFLPRSKHLLISWLQSPSAVILEPQKTKSATVSPSICHEVMGLDAIREDCVISKRMKNCSTSLVIQFSSGTQLCPTLSNPMNHRMLIFKPAFSLSSFIFIKRLFSSSSLSAIRVVSYTYLRLLIFLPAILIPVCISSSLAFYMMYSV